MLLRYANSQDAGIITKIVFQAFKSKFKHLIPENPKDAFLFFYSYYYHGLERIKDKIIISYNSKQEIQAILVLDGLGIPIFSLNPPLRILINTYKKLGLKSLFRLIFGILLIEGYPPSNNYLYINTIIVDSSYRGKGIAFNLMILTERIAKKKNMKGVSLYVDIDNSIALRLYKKLGYQISGGFGNKFVKNLIGVKKYLYLVKRI
ncbi:MAG: GNAT family N-acetyltransferase [Candidatus Hodarchaeales archaeon]